MTLASRTLAMVVVATGMACAVPDASAEQAVYRWVDANGVVQFTQTAPRGIPYERVSPSGRQQQAPSFYNPRRGSPATVAASSAAGEASDAAPQSLSADQQQRQAALQEEAQARLSEIAEARRRNCELARQQFEEFTTFARIRVADGQGGVRILSEEERAERLAEAEQAILLNCDDAG